MLLKTSIGLTAASLLLAAVPAHAAGSRISIGDDYYSPRVKTVSKGTRVVWINYGRDAHTVTTTAWSRRLDPGERYARVVRRGFRYHCRFHDMRGRVAIG